MSDDAADFVLMWIVLPTVLVTLAYCALALTVFPYARPLVPLWIILLAIVFPPGLLFLLFYVVIFTCLFAPPRIVVVPPPETTTTAVIVAVPDAPPSASKSVAPPRPVSQGRHTMVRDPGRRV